MLIVQKFHSIHEIDPEFIPNIEVLLQEDMAHFNTLVERHDVAPSTDVFTYFLFFGPTQNTPIGFAELSLRQIPADDLIPWHKRLKFWNKDHEHWKQATWHVGDGSAGLCVFDPKFSRSGKEKMQEIIKDYVSRGEIKAHHFFTLKGLQDFDMGPKENLQWSKESFVLEALTKASKSYEDYLSHLKPNIQKLIKGQWKKIHKDSQIKLGDYPSPAETPQTLPLKEELLKIWEKWGAQVLTFEKDLKVLGCILVLKGRNGNIFFEPFPFETESEPLVDDELYTQYALLKFFEMKDARKCHMMKFGAKLVFEDKEDLEFFKDQGFQLKTVTQTFSSTLLGLTKPV